MIKCIYFQEDKRRKLHHHHSDDNDDGSSGNDSDLDLDKDLKPIGFYVRQRDQMLEHMFKSIGKRKLKAMLPEILKVALPLTQVTVNCRQPLDQGHRAQCIECILFNHKEPCLLY